MTAAKKKPGAQPQNIRRRVNRIEARMGELGMTLETLAAKVGTTYQNVSAHRNGRAVPTLDTAFAYSRALEVSIEDLFFPGGKASWDGPPALVGSFVCGVARRAPAGSKAAKDGNCPRCGLPADGHARKVVETPPHPNDWRRALAADEKALLAAIAARSGRHRVAEAVRDLGLTKKRAFAILGAWADWGWYDPGTTVIGGDLTDKGVGEARRLARAA